jgi:hypothetical protein
MVFTLSILGVGLFSYYQGRSHNIVLTAVLWPAVLLMAIFIDELRQIISQGTEEFSLSKMRSWVGFYLLYGFLILLCLIFTVGTVSHLNEMANYSLSQFSTSLSEYPEEFQSKIDLIKANTDPNEKVLILAINSGILYAETNTNNPIPVPGITELMAKKDLRKIQAYLESPSIKKLFIEPEVIKKFPDLTKSLLKGRLKEAGKDVFGNLILYSARRY